MAKKYKESAKRVVKLLAFLGDTQAQFARRLSITQPMVSAWVGASDAPSPAFCIRLGKLAPFPDNLWFWEQAGLSEQDIISAATHISEKWSRLPSDREIIGIPRMRFTGKRNEPVEPSIPLLGEFVFDRSRTIWIDVNESLAGPFSVGDILKLDQDEGTALDERFKNKLVLVEFPPEREGYRLFAIPGRAIGTLRYGRCSITLGSSVEFIPVAAGAGVVMVGWYVPSAKRRAVESAGLAKVMVHEEEELKRIKVIGRVTGWLAVLKPSEK
jgi:transcriptional regulator with XRE-family HTH domain